MADIEIFGKLVNKTNGILAGGNQVSVNVGDEATDLQSAIDDGKIGGGAKNWVDGDGDGSVVINDTNQEGEESETNSTEGAYSVCEGSGNIIVYGDCTHAEGSGNYIGDYMNGAGANSHAEGADNKIYADNAHAEGKDNTIGDEGGDSTADCSHAEGEGNTVTGRNAHAEGYGNTVSGDDSHAEGGNNTVEGDYSHVEGDNNTVSGSYSHAEGQSNTVEGDRSHAEGYSNTVEGDYSHAEGQSNTASGDNSHAEGDNNTASGDNSHAEGSNCIASGDNSHAEGSETHANNDCEHASGHHNKSHTGDTDADQTLFSVGYGTSFEGENAFEIMQNGEAFFAEDVHLCDYDNSPQDKYKYSLKNVIERSFDYAAFSKVVRKDTAALLEPYVDPEWDETSEDPKRYIIGISSLQNTMRLVYDFTCLDIEYEVQVIKEAVNTDTSETGVSDYEVEFLIDPSLGTISTDTGLDFINSYEDVDGDVVMASVQSNVLVFGAITKASAESNDDAETASE